MCKIRPRRQQPAELEGLIYERSFIVILLEGSTQIADGVWGERRHYAPADESCETTERVTVRGTILMEAFLWTSRSREKKKPQKENLPQRHIEMFDGWKSIWVEAGLRFNWSSLCVIEVTARLSSRANLGHIFARKFLNEMNQQDEQ